MRLGILLLVSTLAVAPAAGAQQPATLLNFAESALEAVGARLKGDEDAERAHLERALEIADRLPGKIPDSSVLPILERLAEMYPGGRPNVAESVRRNAVRIWLRLLPLRRAQYGPVSEQVERQCFGLAWMTSALGDLNDALGHYRCVLESRRQRLGEEHSETALAWGWTGDTLGRLDRFADAEIAHRRAIALIEKARGESHAETGQIWSGYSHTLLRQGRIQEYEAALRKTIAIFERAAGPESENYLFHLGSLAGFYASWERFEEADAINQRAYAVLNAREPEGFVTALYAWRAGSAELRARRYAQARALFERSLALHRKYMGESYLHLGSLRTSLADVAEAEGDRVGAARLVNEALEFWRRIGQGNSVEAAYALTRLGRFALDSGALDVARSELDQALAIQATSLNGGGAQAIWTLFYRARVEERGKAPGAAAAYLERALAGVRRQLATTDNLRLDTLRARQSYRPVVSEYLSASVAGGVAAAATGFEAAQLANVTDTAATVARMAARFAGGDDALARLLREQQDAIRRWREVDTALATMSPGDDATKLPALRAERDRLEADMRAYDKRLAQEFPRHRALTSSDPVTLDETRSLLRKGEGLVAFHFHERGGYAWAVTGSGERFVPLALDAKRLEGMVSRLRRGVDLGGGALRPFDTVLAHELYRELLAPLEAALAGVDHLMVVPDGALRSLPLGLLVTTPPAPDKGVDNYADQGWLIRRHALSTLPSVATLRALRRMEGAATWERPFAGFADPVLEGPGGDPRRGLSAGVLFRGARGNVDELRRLDPLPESREEVLRMARILKAGTADVFLGRDATESRVRSTPLARYRVLAFATHGLMSGEMQGMAEPALVLTPPRAATEDDDGLLTASEIAGLKLGAEWVILSACNTAAPDGTPGGESLSGLAKAFFYAGARAVLVSHWYVASAATTALTTTMLQRYSERPEIGKAQALRASMLALIEDRERPVNAHPALWAPFVVSGEGGR